MGSPTVLGEGRQWWVERHPSVPFLDHAASERACWPSLLGVARIEEKDGPRFIANASEVFKVRVWSPRRAVQPGSAFTGKHHGHAVAQDFEDGFAPLSGQLGGTVCHGWVSGK